VAQRAEVKSMSIQEIMPFASNILAIVLVLGGAWFAASKVWPWYIDRDALLTTHRLAIERQQAENEGLIASALSVLGEHLRQPIDVNIVNK
jgi:hypothetical protein